MGLGRAELVVRWRQRPECGLLRYGWVMNEEVENIRQEKAWSVSMETMLSQERISLSEMGGTQACSRAEGIGPSERSEIRREWWQMMELVQGLPEGWCSGWAVLKPSGTAHSLRSKDAQTHWDKQGHCKPIGWLYEK